MSDTSNFISGLDLGKQQDHTALAIIEKFERAKPLYHVRHLHRYHLGIDYMVIADELAGLFGKPPLLGSQLAVDMTGVGIPVVEMIRAKEMDVAIMGVMITGGFQASLQADRRTWHVPKRDLASAVKLALESNRLMIAKDLPHAALLKKELQNFQVKISKAANEIFEAREGEHDDLVLSVAMAVWLGETRFTGGWDTTPARGSRSMLETLLPPGFFPGQRDDEDEGDIPSPRQVYGCSDEDHDRFPGW